MWTMIFVGLFIVFGIFLIALYVEDGSQWFLDDEE
jgi:hypothetical protein